MSDEVVSRETGAAVALDALRRIVRALRVAAAGVEKTTGLTAAQLYVLQQVALTPGESFSEIGRRTLTDRTSVGAVVDRLVQRGLVERERKAGDRRRASVTLTDAGRVVLEQAPHPPTRRLLDALETLEDGDIERLATGLSALQHAMGLAGEPAGMLFDETAASNGA